jgi:hypothetical protein
MDLGAHDALLTQAVFRLSEPPRAFRGGVLAADDLAAGIPMRRAVPADRP